MDALSRFAGYMTEAGRLEASTPLTHYLPPLAYAIDTTNVLAKQIVTPLTVALTSLEILAAVFRDKEISRPFLLRQIVLLSVPFFSGPIPFAIAFILDILNFHQQTYYFYQDLKALFQSSPRGAFNIRKEKLLKLLTPRNRAIFFTEENLSKYLPDLIKALPEKRTKRLEQIEALPEECAILKERLFYKDLLRAMPSPEALDIKILDTRKEPFQAYLRSLSKTQKERFLTEELLQKYLSVSYLSNEVPRVVVDWVEEEDKEGDFAMLKAHLSKNIPRQRTTLFFANNLQSSSPNGCSKRTEFNRKILFFTYLANLSQDEVDRIFTEETFARYRGSFIGKFPDEWIEAIPEKYAPLKSFLQEEVALFLLSQPFSEENFTKIKDILCKETPGKSTLKLPDVLLNLLMSHPALSKSEYLTHETLTESSPKLFLKLLPVSPYAFFILFSKKAKKEKLLSKEFLEQCKKGFETFLKSHQACRFSSSVDCNRGAPALQKIIKEPFTVSKRLVQTFATKTGTSCPFSDNLRITSIVFTQKEPSSG